MQQQDANLRGRRPVPGSVHACGSCKERPPRFLCPTCPRRDQGQNSDDRHGWGEYTARSPNRARLERACASAARTLSITPDSSPRYPEALADYRQACDARDRYLAAQRENLPKPQPTRLGAFQSPASSVPA